MSFYMRSTEMKTSEDRFYSTMKTKDVEEAPVVYDKFPIITSVPNELRMDYSRLLNKPFYVGSFTWDTTQVFASLPFAQEFPTLMLNNYLAKVPFESSTMFRMRACIQFQVAGTPMHQGILLAAALPRSYERTIFAPGQLLVAPHVFMNANESTPACLEVPFYSATRLASSDIDNHDVAVTPFNYAKVHVMVMNPLEVSSSATTSLTVSMHVVIKEADFYVPRNASAEFVPECGVVRCGRSTGNCKGKCQGVQGKRILERGLCCQGEVECDGSCATSVSEEFEAETLLSQLYSIPTRIFDGLAIGAKMITGDVIDIARGFLKEYTGFHNPNSAAINSRMIYSNRNFLNNVDQPTLIEKLDAHAQFDRITSDFVFCTDNDEMLVSRMVSKPAYLNTFVVDSTTTTSTLLFAYPITPMAEVVNSPIATTFFSPIRALYESSRYWRGSLKFHIQASMTNFQYCKLLVVKQYSNDRRVFSTGHPNMDDCHNMLTDTFEFSAGGQIQTLEAPYCALTNQLECTRSLTTNAVLHGMVYVYLLQPLVTNGSVPTTVRFNVYMTGGEDLEFYGYGTDLYQNEYITRSRAKKYPREQKSGSTTAAQTSAASLTGASSSETDKKKGADFVSEMGSNEVTVGVSGQTEIINENANVAQSVNTLEFKPNVSLRDYVRRMTHCRNQSFMPAATVPTTFVLNVEDLNISPEQAYNSNGLLRSMFYGMNGGYKVRITCKFADTLQLFYIPPGTVVDGSGDTVLRTYPFLNVATGPLSRGAARTNFSLMEQEIPSSVYGIGSNTMQVFEFVIPNMNPCSFLDNSRVTYQEALGTDRPFSSSLGQIVVSLPPSSAGPVVFSTSIASTDETRYGFHCLPAVGVPKYAVDGGEFVRVSPFGMGSGGIGILPDTTHPYYCKTS